MTETTLLRRSTGPNRFYQISTVLQMLVDGLTVAAAFQLSYLLWEISPFRRRFDIILPGEILTAIVALVFVLFMFLTGVYRKRSTLADIRGDLARLTAVFLASGFLIVLSFFFQSFLLGRSQIVIFILMVLILLALQGALVGRLQAAFLQRGIGARRVLIFGAGQVGRRLARALLRRPALGYLPLGFIDDKAFLSPSKDSNPLQVLGDLTELDRVTEQLSIDELIIAVPSASAERIRRIIDTCEKLDLPFKYVPDLHDTAIQKVRTEEIDGIPLFSVRHLDYTPLQAFVKRGFDLVLSTGAMLLAAPFMAAIGLAIRLDSPGPMIFKQERIGRRGRKFIMHKFRTMIVDAPAYARHPLDKNDPRITRVGRVLRRTSLDELPQFWNVLIGEMSVVGPRPEMAFIVEDYTELERERLNVKPGITGLWQISADRALPIHENIDHDLYYIQNQSLLLDLIILGKTLLVPLHGIGAR